MYMYMYMYIYIYIYIYRCTSWRAAASPPPPNKMSVFGQKIDAIWAKINHIFFNLYIAYSSGLWMIILIIPEMNIIDVFSLI